MVALKTDLRGENSSYISYAEGKQMADEIGALSYVECSAKTREGLNEVYEIAIRHVLEVRYPSVSEESSCCVVL